MIWLILIYILVVIVWGIVSYFPLKNLYDFGFAGDASMQAKNIYFIVSACIIILGFILIIVS